jgi:hypothetical protein
VVAPQRAVSTVLACVRIGPAEHLGDPSGDMLEMSASATGGWLKPVHAALMHGILALPLLAWLVSKAGCVLSSRLA